MIKSPSIQHEFSLVWSGDPALSLPEKTDENAEERTRIIEAAQATGVWPIAEGQQPTLFHFKDPSRTDLGWWDGERTFSAKLQRPLSSIEASDLILRLTLRGVDNFGKHKVSRRQHGPVWLADESIINAISDEAGHEPLAEFASVILERVRNPIRPL